MLSTLWIHSLNYSGTLSSSTPPCTMTVVSFACDNKEPSEGPPKSYDHHMRAILTNAG